MRISFENKDKDILHVNIKHHSLKGNEITFITDNDARYKVILDNKLDALKHYERFSENISMNLSGYQLMLWNETDGIWESV